VKTKRAKETAYEAKTVTLAGRATPQSPIQFVFVVAMPAIRESD
jgi:hypothetical protein